MIQATSKPRKRDARRRRGTMRIPSGALMSVRLVLAVAGAALLGGVGLAAPAAAIGTSRPSRPPASTYAMSSGRLGAPLVAAVLGLIGVVIGGLALGRPAGRFRHRLRATRRHRGPGGGADPGHGPRWAGCGHRRRWYRHRQRAGRGHRGPGGGADRHGHRWAGLWPAPGALLPIRRAAPGRGRPSRSTTGSRRSPGRGVAHSAAARASARATSSTSEPRSPTVTRTWARTDGAGR